MKNMEPLYTTKQVLIWLCLHPANGSSISKWTRIGRRMLPLLLLVLILCAITVSLSFIIKFQSTNVEATLFTFIVLMVYVGLLYIMVIAFHSRSCIVALLEQLTKIYDTSLYLMNPFQFTNLSIRTIQLILIFYYFKLKM